MGVVVHDLLNVPLLSIFRINCTCGNAKTNVNRLIWKLSFFFHYLLVVNFFSSMINRVGCTMISIRSRTIKWYLLNLRLTHKTMEVWAKICWLAIGIMYLVWSTWLPMDCCSSELRIYYIDAISRCGLVQGGHHYHFIKCNFYSHDKHVSEILLIWRYTTIIHHSF
jgi:hypothetical protein